MVGKGPSEDGSSAVSITTIKNFLYTRSNFSAKIPVCKYSSSAISFVLSSETISFTIKCNRTTAILLILLNKSLSLTPKSFPSDPGKPPRARQSELAGAFRQRQSLHLIGGCARTSSPPRASQTFFFWFWSSGAKIPRDPAESFVLFIPPPYTKGGFLVSCFN